MEKKLGKIKQLDSAKLADIMEKGRKKEASGVPAFVSKDFEVDELVKKKRVCYRLTPKDEFNGTYLFYLYGSKMCKLITEQHWEFITNLAKDTHAGIYIPIYPIAPEDSCRDTFDMLKQVYADFGKNFDVEKIILIGDGAGGGLALSLALIAWDEGFRKPDQLILASPVLDTEFFDKKLEGELLEKAYDEKNIFFSPAVKDFINEYWVKDYAVKTKYTSPFYEDFTDICDDVLIFSSRDEMFASYNEAFYEKAKKQGINIRFYEFENEKHDFLIYSKSDERNKAYQYLVDTINNTYDGCMQHIYMVKRMAGWSKKYPEIIKSDAALKFMYGKKFDFSSVEKKESEYRDLLMASSYAVCDHKVKQYIKMFPNCTVVQVGCQLDDMFSRVDNGRIQWYSIGSHNNMSIRRSIYGEKDREITIGRNIMDFSWIDDISCERKKGLIFVFNDSLANMKQAQVKGLLEELKNKFPGAELVFTTTTVIAKFNCNVFKKTMVNTRKRKFAVEDAHKLFGNWSPEYKIVSEEAIVQKPEGKRSIKLRTKLRRAYNHASLNYKIVQLKLGGEVYDIVV